MSPAFKQLGYTKQGINLALATIKAKHDKSVAQPDYRLTVPVDSCSAGPGSQRPSQKTIVKSRFVLFVMKEYEQQTGKRARLSIKDGIKGGPFVAFLLAVADELDVDSTGLVGRAQKLMTTKRLNSTIHK